MTIDARLKEWFLRHYFGPSLFPRQQKQTWPVPANFGLGLGGWRDELNTLFDHYVSTGDLKKNDDGSYERIKFQESYPEVAPPPEW